MISNKQSPKLGEESPKLSEESPKLMAFDGHELRGKCSEQLQDELRAFSIAHQASAIEPMPKLDYWPEEDPATPLPKGVIHEEVRIVYGQESDCEDSDQLGQQLEITSVWSPSGGHFTYIKTRRWAVNALDELRAILKDFEARTNLLHNP